MAKDYRELSATFAEYKVRIYKNTRENMRQAAYRIAESAKKHLAQNGSIQTGNLFFSSDFGTKEEGNKIIAYVTFNAERDGVKYAEFVEFGTGRYNTHGDGRQTPWRYQDAFGDWWWTVGSRPKPFIRPAFAENIGLLRKQFMQKLMRID